MKKNMKLGLTLALTGALAMSSVSAFAATDASGSTAIRQHQGIVDLMLKDGVITQTQIDKYQDLMHEQRESEVKAALQALVTKGTLTQAKADAVIKVMDEQHAKMEALRTKLDAMTDEEAKAYLTANPVVKNDGMIKLVENGTLTAAEYDAVKAAIGGGHRGMGGQGGKGGPGHMGGMKMGRGLGR